MLVYGYTLRTYINRKKYLGYTSVIDGPALNNNRYEDRATLYCMINVFQPFIQEVYTRNVYFKIFEIIPINANLCVPLAYDHDKHRNDLQKVS